MTAVFLDNEVTVLFAKKKGIGESTSPWSSERQRTLAAHSREEAVSQSFFAEGTRVVTAEGRHRGAQAHALWNDSRTCDPWD